MTILSAKYKVTTHKADAFQWKLQTLACLSPSLTSTDHTSAVAAPMLLLSLSLSNAEEEEEEDRRGAEPNRRKEQSDVNS
ncbi:hypothetical protein EUGRSUZ_G00414 [Eucalyptus grandis]|uniref:Uncharacterized protein n=2 Tax=Eucalyptus grandis TaxID=71139 RepID=A0ACC3K038_EUCGR|nr:hypothetical protein EUGRSUZ_G00414 [Eucalyptus grandis]